MRALCDENSTEVIIQVMLFIDFIVICGGCIVKCNQLSSLFRIETEKPERDAA